MISKLCMNALYRRSVYFTYSCISICLWKPQSPQIWIKLCKMSLITFCHWSRYRFFFHTPQWHSFDGLTIDSVLLLHTPVKNKQADFHWVSDLHCTELNSELILKGLTSTRTTTKQGSSKCKGSGSQGGKKKKAFHFEGL